MPDNDILFFKDIKPKRTEEFIEERGGSGAIYIKSLFFCILGIIAFSGIYNIIILLKN